MATLCSMWGVSARELEKILYGDNRTAIGMASGTAAGTWRTRHLRIRAAILREAASPCNQLPEGFWKIQHLKGAELVADGLTKALLGQSFFRFLEDLGMVMPPREEHGQAGQATLPPPNGKALLAVIACVMIAQATAHDVKNQELTAFDGWMCVSFVLMLLGALRVAQWIAHAVGAMWGRMSSLTSAPSGETCAIVVNADQQPDDGDSEVTNSEEYDAAHVAALASVEDAPSSSGMTQRSGKQPAAASSSDALKSTSSASRTGTNDEKGSRRKSNPWNEFQSRNKGKGWSSDRMRAEYFKEAQPKRKP